MKAETSNWLESAQYDIDSADAMFRTSRYLYVVFLCHLAIEKSLKAVIAEATGEIPPRSHDLTFLAKRTGVELPSEHLSFVGKINFPRPYGRGFA